MRINRTRAAGAIAAAAIAALLVAPNAPAAGIVVGSTLKGTFPAYRIGGSAALTIANTVLPEAGARPTSPVNGTVVAWRITGASGGPFRLRVLRPTGGGSYTGAGTSSGGIPSDYGLQTFATSLPIRIGDLIGLDDTNPPDLSTGQPGDKIGTAAIPGAGVSAWNPVLADGATAGPWFTVADTEFGFNATVEPTPLSFGKVKRNKHRGTATLTVNAPNPGGLVLVGKGLKTVTRTVADAGKVKLPIKPKGKVRQKLNGAGKAKVGASVTFSPPGVSADTETRKLTLRKRL